MKKLFVIFFSMLYLLMAIGFTQYAHFCKKLATLEISLTNNLQNISKNKCSNCEDQGKKGQEKDCCQYDVKTLKLDKSLQKQNQQELSVKFWGIQIPNFQLGTVFDFAYQQFDQQNPHYLSSKLTFSGNPYYILHCIYRI